jgi:hypothetical protein
MNRFRKLGFINYSGRIQVYKSRLSAALLDQLPKQCSQRQPIVAIAQDAFHSAALGSQHAAHAAD